jgi:hypothetical protein
LVLDLGERRALGLGLNDTAGLAIDEEEVVDPSMALLEDELPHRDPRARANVRGVGLLDEPAGQAKLPVDLYARTRFAS